VRKSKGEKDKRSIRAEEKNTNGEKDKRSIRAKEKRQKEK
jgi:hypothetical protein